MLKCLATGSPLLRCVEMSSYWKSFVEVCLKCLATGSPLLRCVEMSSYRKSFVVVC